MNKCLNCNKLVKNKYCSISCQNIHQGSLRADKKYGEYKLFTVECCKCKISFEIKEREKLFPQKDMYYCSRSCANVRVHSEKTKDKLKSILNNVRPVAESKEHNRICKHCQITFYAKPSKLGVFCSKSCKASFMMSNGLASDMGKKSASSQGDRRRSKNEIYFAELCKQKFSVLENITIFNGWDADIILPDLKLAILWNGVWHYKKITRKHSVLQVQNRDKIKENEILKAGYKPYVIKDMGKWNKKFVEEKFQEMLVYLKLIS